MEEIKAILIFEMLGRPAEHLSSTLEKFIDRIAQEKDLEMTNRKINEPKKVEQSQRELFTIFAETEITFRNLMALIRVIFIYMPSHVEIIKPDELRIKNFDFNSLANELVRRLHQYDEITKRLALEIGVLQNRLQETAKPVA